MANPENNTNKSDHVVMSLSTSRLPQILFHFIHHSNFEEVRETWIRRIKRINYNNIFVVLDITDDDQITPDDIMLLRTIPYKTIVLYRGAESYIYNIKEKYEIKFGQHQDYMIFKQMRNKEGVRYYKKYYELFDWAKWLNEGYKK